MVKWTVELEEYDIEYKPRVAINAQALTDFLIEMIQPEEKEVWRVFVDGASNLSGRGVGVVLIAPSGEKEIIPGPFLKCLAENEGEYVLQKIHEGCCGEHLGGTALARETILAGFWWPRINQDAAQIVQTCKSCQYHSTFQHNPTRGMQPISASCPFDQWGMDIVGTFPVARTQKKFLLVAVDYFSKWVKSEPLAKTTEKEVMKFL
ncbi:uncharacterized protein LOC142552404 [Primulina tabacum]|uniref:uncharacterized protein LOC142552404 n=1 Tax=Primulina tabacum TaxID=48773 RepID=UPI003F5A6839